MDSEFGGEQMFGGDGGSMEFGWMRGSVRDEQIQSRGNTKGGNNKIGIVNRVNQRYWKRIRREDWYGT